MKTDDLISLLAAGAAAMPKNTVNRRFAVAFGCGFPLAVLLMAVIFGIRADLVQALSGGLLWLKLAFAGSLALAGFIASDRLARPGVPLGGVVVGLLLPFLVLWLIAATVLFDVAPAQRADLILGDTWKTCALNIALISLPLIVASLWAMKGLAPTHLALAGVSAGLFAGALGTMVYALHCPESSAPFIAIWYVLGIAIPTLAGGLLGPRMFRW
jgi:hypothetical protein